MSDEELKIMEEKVQEAHRHLIELNDAYNELLAKEHEEKAKKSNARRNGLDMLNLSEELGIEKKEMTEEDVEIAKLILMFWVRELCILLISLLSLPVGIILNCANIICAVKKKEKIRNKYKSNDSKKNEDTQEKPNKDALFDELCEARRVYQTLRKEFEKMISNSNLDSVDNQEVGTVEESLGVAGDTVNPKVYEIYSEYIKYVKNICPLEGSRISTFNSKTYELKNEDYNQTRI